jgi:hypothetical protein
MIMPWQHRLTILTAAPVGGSSLSEPDLRDLLNRLASGIVWRALDEPTA